MPNRSLLPKVLLFLIILASSCKGVHDIGFTGAGGFEFKGMENNAMNFAADIGVKNPSAIGFKVVEVNLKATIDGIFIGTLTATDRVRIPARTDSSYRMNFSLQLANIVTGASTLYTLSRKKQVNADLSGYVRARSWLTVKKVDVHESRDIEVPRNYR